MFDIYLTLAAFIALFAIVFFGFLYQFSINNDCQIDTPTEYEYEDEDLTVTLSTRLQ